MPEKNILEKSDIYLDYMASDRIPFPKSLQIELTSYCNMKCVMCPRTLGTHRSEPNQKMENDILDYIISSIVPYVQRVDVVGDGEPLIAADLLFNLLEGAEYFKVPVTLCSNGELMDEVIAQELVRLNLADINFSLDAARPETYKKIRGASFAHVIQNIQSLTYIKQTSHKQTPHIHLSMVAMRDNIDELPELVNLAQEIGADSITVQAMGEEVEAMKGLSVFLHQRDKAEELLYKSLIESKARNLRLNLWPEQLMDVLSDPHDLGPFLAGQAPPPGDPALWRKNCSFLWETPFITTNGDVRPCCAKLPVMGNIKNEPFHKIWYSKAFRELRKRLISGDPPEACRKCPGMGWRKIIYSSSRLTANDHPMNFFPGWFDLEHEERDYRWSRDRAVLFLSRKKSDQFLLLQLRKSELPGAPDHGTIIIDSDQVFPFQLPSDNWTTLEYPLNPISSDQVLKAEINVSHSIRPCDAVKNTMDSRDLGIKFNRIWLESWPQKVVFGKQLVLLGFEVTPENWRIGDTVRFITYWRSLDKTTTNLKMFLHFTRLNHSSPVSTPLKRKLGIGRKDFFQADELLHSNGIPSAQWKTGIFVAYESHLHIPENLNPGEYRIDIGLYPDNSTKNRIPISRSDRPAGKHTALLGAVQISERMP